MSLGMYTISLCIHVSEMYHKKVFICGYLWIREVRVCVCVCVCICGNCCVFCLLPDILVAIVQ